MNSVQPFLNEINHNLTALSQEDQSIYESSINTEIDRLYSYDSVNIIDEQKMTTIKLLLLNDIKVNTMIHDDLKYNLFKYDKLFNSWDNFKKIIDMDIFSSENNQSSNLNNQKYHPEERNKLLQYSIIPDIHTKLKYKNYLICISNLFKTIKEQIKSEQDKLKNLLKTDNFKEICEINIKQSFEDIKNEIDIYLKDKKTEIDQLLIESKSNNSSKINNIKQELKNLNTKIKQKELEIQELPPELNNTHIKKDINTDEKNLVNFYCNLFNKLKDSYNNVLSKKINTISEEITAELNYGYLNSIAEIDTEFNKLKRKKEFYEKIKTFNEELNLIQENNL